MHVCRSNDAFCLIPIELRSRELNFLAALSGSIWDKIGA